VRHANRDDWIGASHHCDSGGTSGASRLECATAICLFMETVEAASASKAMTLDIFILLEMSLTDFPEIH
jgi:hypothetical protein